MISNWKKLKNLTTGKVYCRLLSSWCYGSVALVICYIKQKIHLVVYDIAGTVRRKQWDIGTVHMQQNINYFLCCLKKGSLRSWFLMISWSYTINVLHSPFFTSPSYKKDILLNFTCDNLLGSPYCMNPVSTGSPFYRLRVQ